MLHETHNFHVVTKYYSNMSYNSKLKIEIYYLDTIFMIKAFHIYQRYQLKLTFFLTSNCQKDKIIIVELTHRYFVYLNKHKLRNRNQN